MLMRARLRFKGTRKSYFALIVAMDRHETAEPKKRATIDRKEECRRLSIDLSCFRLMVCAKNQKSMGSCVVLFGTGSSSDRVCR
jgi:hypothetical protein